MFHVEPVGDVSPAHDSLLKPRARSLGFVNRSLVPHDPRPAEAPQQDALTAGSL